ncbi:metalloprotease [Botrimarina hoheduenensis]|nr:site-2 protease family protein [Botrimarina hoheduenensis]
MARDPGDSLLRWSLPVGHGIWLHATLLGPLLVGLGIAAQVDSPLSGLLLVSVWLLSLLAHEASHVLAAARVGGDYRTMVLGPLGGLSTPRLPNDPEATVFVAMAGPIANLSLVVLAAFGLAMYDETGLAAMFLPMSNNLTLSGITDSNTVLLTLAKLLVCVNWPLFVLNLLPAWPFDGGAALRGLLWPLTGRYSAAAVVGRLAILIGFALVITAWFAEGSLFTVPASIWIISLGTLVLFGGKADLPAGDGWVALASGPSRPESLLRDARNTPHSLEADDSDDDLLVLVEFTGGAESIRPRADEGGPPDRRGPHRSTKDEDEALLDRVLAKLHALGSGSLTSDEQQVLQQASQRLRSRQRP